MVLVGRPGERAKHMGGGGRAWGRTPRQSGRGWRETSRGVGTTLCLLILSLAVPVVGGNSGSISSAMEAGLHELDTGLGSMAKGRVGALGDFDSDMHADIFWIDDAQRTVSVLLWDDSARRYALLSTAVVSLPPQESGTVISLVPVDFNRDGRLDILVVGFQGSSSSLLIYFGNGEAFSSPLRLAGPADVMPVVVEADGDLKPDLFGTAKMGGSGSTSASGDSKRVFWLNRLPTRPECGNGKKDAGEEGVDCGGDSCLPCSCFATTTPPMDDGESCGFKISASQDMDGRSGLSQTRGASFADMDGDCLADIIAPNELGEVEIWINRYPPPAPLSSAPAPQGAKMHVAARQMRRTGRYVHRTWYDASESNFTSLVVAGGCVQVCLDDVMLMFARLIDRPLPAPLLPFVPGPPWEGCRGSALPRS